MNLDDIKAYIVEWNMRFPVDRWWRKSFNIAFNSSDHRESNFIDQLIEYYEIELFNEAERKEEYTPNIGDWIVKREIDMNNLEDSIKDLRDEFKDVE